MFSVVATEVTTADSVMWFCRFALELMHVSEQRYYFSIITGIWRDLYAYCTNYTWSLLGGLAVLHLLQSLNTRFVRRVWGLPLNTHNVLIPLISNRLSLYDEIRKRMLADLYSELLTKWKWLVSFVTRHAVWFGRMSSPLGRNAFHCCHQFVMFFGQVTLCHSPFCIWFLYFESW